MRDLRSVLIAALNGARFTPEEAWEVLAEWDRTHQITWDNEEDLAAWKAHFIHASREFHELDKLLRP